MARVLVIGGTGTISTHTVGACLAAGHKVATFNRGQRAEVLADDRVRHVVGDRNDREALSDAIAAVEPDALIDFVCFEPTQAEALAEVAKGRVGHLVFVSSVDAFGFPLLVLPAPEDAPLNQPVGSYAAKKRCCEELLRARQGRDMPLTIVRPTYSMGPRFVIGFFDASSATMMNRIRKGLPVVVPGDGHSRIHPSASRDTGRMIARVVGEPAAFGKTYTCGTDGAHMPVDNYVRLIAGVIGREPHLVHIPKELIAASRLPEVTEGLYHNVTRFDLAFAFDQFKADFPDLTWEADLAAPIRSYFARLDAEGLFGNAPVRGIDDVLVDAWRKARAIFAT